MITFLHLIFLRLTCGTVSKYGKCWDKVCVMPTFMSRKSAFEIWPQTRQPLGHPKEIYNYFNWMIAHLLFLHLITAIYAHILFCKQKFFSRRNANIWSPPPKIDTCFTKYFELCLQESNWKLKVRITWLMLQIVFSHIYIWKELLKL